MMWFVSRAREAQKDYRRKPASAGRSTQGWLSVMRGEDNKLHWKQSPGDAGQSPQPRLRTNSIRGAKNDMPILLEAGGAVPGDRVVGVLAPGEGIRVFQIHSPASRSTSTSAGSNLLGDRQGEPGTVPGPHQCDGAEQPGTLAQIADVIGQAGGNIDNLKMIRRASDFTELKIGLEVWDLTISQSDHRGHSRDGHRHQGRACLRMMSLSRMNPESSSMPIVEPAHLSPRRQHRPRGTVRNARGGRHPDPVRAGPSCHRSRLRRDHSPSPRRPPPHPR